MTALMIMERRSGRSDETLVVRRRVARIIYTGTAGSDEDGRARDRVE